MEMVAVTFANSVYFANTALQYAIGIVGIRLAEAYPIGGNVKWTDDAPQQTPTADLSVLNE